MGKLFILGFNADTPRGGVLDLLTMVDTVNNDFGDDLIRPDFTILPSALAIIASLYEPFERYQVVHMDMHGGILMVEHWKKAPFLTLPSQYELLCGSIFENQKGDYVRQHALQLDCGTSVGYRPDA
jgi:hypothetical protein